ncbi:MAG: FecR domain-containing protein [Phycisphaeraceae bacterium]|nr:FecR domain-containing protein [Phycisphaeraceae bacterium]
MERDPAELIEAYFSGELDAAGASALRAWLREDPSRFERLASESRLEAALNKVYQARRLQGVFDSVDVLDELLRDAEAHPTEPVDITDALERDRRERAQKRTQAPHDISRRTDFVIPKWVVYGGVAALFIAAVIFWPGSQPPATPPVVDNNANTHQPAPPLNSARQVATLTAQHDARWGTPSFSVGDGLRAGQRLTLDAGLAEITTERGTVVVLQGPCTLRLTEADDTLYLQRGRLAADVPPSAVGFTVETPTARVVDYGTQFGVEVDNTGATETAVFEGEVELGELSSDADRPARSIRLTAGWSSSVNKEDGLRREPVALTGQDHARFVRSIEQVQDPGLAYQNAVLKSKPLVYWRFDGETDHVTNEAGQARWAGKPIGRVAKGEGLFGSAVELSSQAETIGVVGTDSPIHLGQTDAYTLEAWCLAKSHHWGRVVGLAPFNPERTKKITYLAIVELLNKEGGITLPFLQDHPSQARFLHRNPPEADTSKGANLFSGKEYPVNQWVHIVAVKDHGVMRLYIDGQLVGEQEDSQGLDKDLPLEFSIGFSDTAHKAESGITPDYYLRSFHGRIDEVALYNTALPLETIQHHFTLGRTGIKN